MKHLYLILASTFFIGFLAGIFVFIESGKPDVVPAPPSEGLVQNEIIADEYGGCAFSGCHSYRILEDGKYTFIENNKADETTVKHADVLSDSRRTELFDSINTTELIRLEKSLFAGTCPIAFDGIAYKFEILFEGERYSIDSCKNNVEGSQFIGTLSDYFQIFNITHIK